MNISLNWLREYVEPGLAPEALSDLLTMAGLEVDGMEATGASFDGVVVGHVLDVRPHPNADRLRVCSVDIGASGGETPEASGDGASEPVQIVCGAPNVAAGQTVPVATVGTVLMLPDRKTGEPSPVEITKSKIRGEVSMGMICAEDELGIGDDHDGILVLDTDAAPGTPLAEVMPAPGDVVYDLAITPNRPDATSHIGVARDVAALTNAVLTTPEVEIPEAGGETAERITVEIEDPEGCPRYAAMLVTGVTVAPSPDWLRQRLTAIGVRPINNVVDVTNYVLHEMGQPLHAFDLAHLAGETIRVRASGAGETMTTLDDQERKLPEGTLLICDAEKPVAIAGVMGGANSEVGDATTDLLIESAYFDPARIRSAAKALNLQTDASYRFERGVDPTAQPRAAARAAQMIAEIAGGTVVPGLVDANPVPYEPTVVTFRPERARALIGAEIEDDEMADLLQSIGFGVEESDADALDAFASGALASGHLDAAADEAEHAGFRVTVPPFRPDVEREVDLIEEVARLWGYDNIPTPQHRARRARSRDGRARGPASGARADAARRARLPRALHQLARPHRDRRALRRRRLDRRRDARRGDAEPDLAGDRGHAAQPAPRHRGRRRLQPEARRRRAPLLRERPRLRPLRACRRAGGRLRRAHGPRPRDLRPRAAPEVGRARARGRLLRPQRRRDGRSGRLWRDGDRRDAAPGADRAHGVCAGALRQRHTPRRHRPRVAMP